MQIAYAQSVQGQSHKKRENLPENKERGRLFPCEDRSCAEQRITADDGTEFSFLCVCDGHGGAPYFRSGTGAEFAIAVIKDLLVRRMEKIRPLAAEGKFKEICSNLAHAVNRNWRAKIDEDLQANPPTEEELSILEEENAGAAAAYRRGEDLYSIYGCTMIAYFATADFWFALQIGDGGFALSMDGRAFTMPVPEDPNCFLNQTTSLCDTDAVKEFRHAAGTELPKAVFCMTDGVENSFGSPEQLCANFCGTVAELPDTGEFADCAVCKKDVCDLSCRRALFEKEITDYLPVLSRKGSGDDVSVALLVQMDESIAKTVPIYLRGKLLLSEENTVEGQRLIQNAARSGSAKALEWFGDHSRDAMRGYAIWNKPFQKEAESAKKFYMIALQKGSATAQKKLADLEAEVKAFEEKIAAQRQAAAVPPAQPAAQAQGAAVQQQPQPAVAKPSALAPAQVAQKPVEAATPVQPATAGAVAQAHMQAVAAAYARHSAPGYGMYVGVKLAHPAGEEPAASESNIPARTENET